MRFNLRLQKYRISFCKLQVRALSFSQMLQVGSQSTKRDRIPAIDITHLDLAIYAIQEGYYEHLAYKLSQRENRSE